MLMSERRMRPTHQRLDSRRRMFLARQHGPHAQGPPTRRPVAWRAQLHRAEAHAQARLTRGTLGRAWYVRLTHFRHLLALHHLPQPPGARPTDVFEAAVRLAELAAVTSAELHVAR
jgi:hypothetical protein